MSPIRWIFFERSVFFDKTSDNELNTKLSQQRGVQKTYISCWDNK